MNSPKFFSAAAPLFLAIFVDGMGLGLLFPILNTLLVDPQSGFINIAANLTMRHFAFGFTISIFMLCWFFGAAYLGDLSDIIGRKKSLLISLIGSVIGYLAAAIAVDIHSFTLLILGRIIAGFTAGSQSIAQASIIDISTPEHKTRNIGYILFFCSFGFVCGPLCGAFFSNNHFVSWFNLSTPFYFAALISLINALLLIKLFRETFNKKGTINVKLHRAITIFISAFQHDKVRHLSVIFLLMLLGWSSYYSFISMFLAGRYQFDTSQIGLFMAVLAGGFGLGFGFLVNYFSQRYALIPTIIIGLIFAAILTLFSVLTHQVIWLWIFTAPIGAAVAIAYSMIITLFSNQVDENAQGWVMGITGSIMALTFAITGLSSAFLADLNVAAPIWFAGIFLLISGLCMINLKTEKANVELNNQEIEPI